MGSEYFMGAYTRIGSPFRRGRFVASIVYNWTAFARVIGEEREDGTLVKGT